MRILVICMSLKENLVQSGNLAGQASVLFIHGDAHHYGVCVPFVWKHISLESLLPPIYKKKLFAYGVSYILGKHIFRY